jgi:hypothetical protein
MFSANSSQVSNDKLFVEDVFSTTVYSGTGGFRAINVGISNFAVEGGMVWMKARNSGAFGDEIHRLYDTARAGGGGGGTLVCAPSLQSNSAIQDNSGTSVTFYPTNTVITTGGGNPNSSGYNYAAWAFRKAPKFFDVVTYTGTGANRNIAHNLGVAPGMIIVKRTDTTGAWQVYHRSNANTQYMVLNSEAAVATGATRWNSTTPTATEFTVGTDATVNASGGTYVAYLYAHDTSSTGLIQCGSYTGNGSTTGPIVTLGWEPQFLIIKNVSDDGRWLMADNMRGMPVQGITSELDASSIASEFPAINGNYTIPTATGFQITNINSSVNTSGQKYIYIAIRRGPMKTPTLGTSVFVPWTRTGTGTTTIVSSTTFPPDLLITRPYASNDAPTWFDRLRGRALSLLSSSTGSETTTTTTTNDLISFNMNGITVGANQQQAVNTNGASIIDYNFRRAPGFMDEVCYAGTGANRTVAHNLGVAPELMIVKIRDFFENWRVYYYPNSSMRLNSTSAGGTSSSVLWNNTDPTSTVFSVGIDNAVNGSGGNYVAYLFASCPGVSKVGSYTGNGSSQTINCGFAAGARFVMIKRTDSAGDWYVWDTARGIVAGNDPHLSLNTTVAEVTTDDTIDTDSSGFVVNQVAATNVNVSSATYIYLAIA